MNNSNSNQQNKTCSQNCSCCPNKYESQIFSFGQITNNPIYMILCLCIIFMMMFIFMIYIRKSSDIKN